LFPLSQEPSHGEVESLPFSFSAFNIPYSLFITQIHVTCTSSPKDNLLPGIGAGVGLPGISAGVGLPGIGTGVWLMFDLATKNENDLEKVFPISAFMIDVIKCY
jgi:hypothetical protein